MTEVTKQIASKRPVVFANTVIKHLHNTIGWMIGDTPVNCFNPEELEKLKQMELRLQRFHLHSLDLQGFALLYTMKDIQPFLDKIIMNSVNLITPGMKPSHVAMIASMPMAKEAYQAVSEGLREVIKNDSYLVQFPMGPGTWNTVVTEADENEMPRVDDERSTYFIIDYGDAFRFANAVDRFCKKDVPVYYHVIPKLAVFEVKEPAAAPQQ